MTFSINVYLAFIGLVIFYMFYMIEICLWKEYNYKNQSYDNCQCDDRRSNGLECENEDDNLQNYFNDFSIGYFILAFSSVSLTCHVVHSLTTVLPPPIPMIDFILGSEKKDANASDVNDSSNPDPQDTKCKIGWSISFKVFCCIVSMAFIGCVIASPYVKFIADCPDINDNDYSHYCRTTEDLHCTFPFVHNNETYYGCSKFDTGSNNHGAWCALDANKYGGYKSIGNCQENCPGRKDSSLNNLFSSLSWM